MSTMPHDLAQAIYRTAHGFVPGGARGLAAKLGLRPGYFNNKCDPKVPGAVVNLLEALAMMQTTGNDAILHTLAAARGYVCVKISDWSGISDMELLNAWAAWDAERGETVQAISTALNNHTITQQELQCIRNEMFEDFQKELELLSRLEGYVEEA